MLSRIRCACSGDDALRVTSRSNVDLVSSIIADSRPPGTTSVADLGPQPRIDLGRIVGEAFDARARRRGGARDRSSRRTRCGHGARLRARARPRSSSCPTPPVPQQMTTRRSSTSSSMRIVTTARCRARTRRRACRAGRGVMSGLKTNGNSICGSGSSSRRRWICSCCNACRSSRNAAACARSSASRCDTKRFDACASSRMAAALGRDPAPGSGGKQPLTTTGPSATPARSSIANAVSTTSLTGVSSASVTSITWQRVGSESRATTSWACLRIGPDSHRVEQAAGRQQERDRVAGGGSVDDHEVGGAGLLDRLHLAEHEDVLHARHRGGDHVERAGRRETLRDPLHPVRHEIVDQRGVGREEPGPHAGVEIDLLVSERGRAEHRGQARLALDLDDQDRPPGAGRGHGQRGGHRGLPDAALAGDDHDAGGRAEFGHLHRSIVGGRLRSARLVGPAPALVACYDWPVRWRRVLVGLGGGASSSPRCRSCRCPGSRARRPRATAASTSCRSTVSSIPPTPHSSDRRFATRSASHSEVVVFQLDASGAVDVDVNALLRDIDRVDGAGHGLGRPVGRWRAWRGGAAGPLGRVRGGRARRASRSGRSDPLRRSVVQGRRRRCTT